MTQVSTEELLVLDFPQQGEKVTSPQYTLRLGAAPDAEKVEVSINGSEYMPARYSVGFWWFDWSGYLPGHHQISCRVRLQDGEVYTTPQRSVKVELGNEGKRRQK